MAVIKIPLANREAVRDYSAPALAARYGEYAARRPEYRCAVRKAFDHGIFRHNSPTLDVGCRNPYQGLLKFLRSFGWEGQYVGVDIDIDPATEMQADDDEAVHLIEMDVEGGPLPFPPTEEKPIKQFACAFLIETFEHIRDKAALFSELCRVAATVYICGPNAAFRGYLPHQAASAGHCGPLTAAELTGYGCQVTGFANFNGRPSRDALMYPHDNGDPKTCSEVWGLWRDERAEAMLQPKPRREAVITSTSSAADDMQAKQMLHEAGYTIEEGEGDRG